MLPYMKRNAGQNCPNHLESFAIDEDNKYCIYPYEFKFLKTVREKMKSYETAINRLRVSITEEKTRITNLKQRVKQLQIDLENALRNQEGSGAQIDNLRQTIIALRAQIVNKTELIKQKQEEETNLQNRRLGFYTAIYQGFFSNKKQNRMDIDDGRGVPAAAASGAAAAASNPMNIDRQGVPAASNPPPPVPSFPQGMAPAPAQAVKRCKENHVYCSSGHEKLIGLCVQACKNPEQCKDPLHWCKKGIKNDGKRHAKLKSYHKCSAIHKGAVCGENMVLEQSVRRSRHQIRRGKSRRRSRKSRRKSRRRSRKSRRKSRRRSRKSRRKSRRRSRKSRRKRRRRSRRRR